MSNQTHWKALGDPNFLGGYDFQEGEKKTLTIKAVKNMEAFNTGERKKETVRACEFKENVKPMILNATNSKMLASLFKTDYVEEWADRQFIVHFDTSVKVGREVVGGLRILNMLPQKQGSAVCHDCKNKITDTGKLNAQQMAIYTQNKYGKALCAECATKIASQQTKGNDVL